MLLTSLPGRPDRPAPPVRLPFFFAPFRSAWLTPAEPSLHPSRVPPEEPRSHPCLVGQRGARSSPSAPAASARSLHRDGGGPNSRASPIPVPLPTTATQSSRKGCRALCRIISPAILRVYTGHSRSFTGASTAPL